MKDGQEVGVESFAVHSNYNATNRTHDISVFKVQTPFTEQPFKVRKLGVNSN